MSEVRVVTIRELCSACHIIEGVVRDMMARASMGLNIEVKWTVYLDPSEAMNHPGLELPKFPALFIDGEQYTAGDIPDPFLLKKWLEQTQTGI